MPKNIFCGIDFGTSNSTCAISDHKGVAMVALENNRTTLPSALFFADQSPTLFGRNAIAAYIDGEDGRLMRSLKSILGTPLMDEKTLVNGKSISFNDILACYIRHLKDQIDTAAQSSIESVILGRPVHFHDEDTEADRKSQNTLDQIAQSVGFKNIAFQYEPIAAAFSHEINVTDEKLSLVIDLGGGTSDFTVIRLSKDRMNNPNRQDDILSTTGIRVGGTTFDQSFSIQSFMPFLGYKSEYRDTFDPSKILTVPVKAYYELSDWAKVHFAQAPQAVRVTKDILKNALDPNKMQNLLEIQEKQLGHAFLQLVENTKIALTDDKETIVDFDAISQTLQTKISRQEFEQAINMHINRITEAFQNSLIQAGITADKIDLVILTGGSTELPIIMDLIQAHFPHAEISQDNKFGSVGLGLAYTARRQTAIR